MSTILIGRNSVDAPLTRPRHCLEHSLNLVSHWTRSLHQYLVPSFESKRQTRLLVCSGVFPVLPPDGLASSSARVGLTVRECAPMARDKLSRHYTIASLACSRKQDQDPFLRVAATALRVLLRLHWVKSMLRILGTLLLDWTLQHLASSTMSGEMSSSQAPRAASPPRPRNPKLRTSCNACSTAKVKCGKEHPRCERCQTNGEDCIYGTNFPTLRMCSKGG